MSTIGSAAAKASAAQQEAGAVERRTLGQTDERVSILGLGGGRLGVANASDAEAQILINQALDLGINYVDTSPGYGDGASEERIGRVLRGRRHEVFLATKVDRRDAAGAREELKTSLRRLQTNVVDLVQLHAVNDEATLDQVLAADGALTALREAQAAGTIRFVGITGHRSPEVLRRALEREAFDTVLLPVGVADHLFHDFVPVVQPLASQQNVGIVGMKAIAHGGIREHGNAALRFALGQPVAVVVVGMSDLDELEANVELADRFTPLSQAEVAELCNGVAAKANEETLWWRADARPPRVPASR